MDVSKPKAKKLLKKLAKGLLWLLVGFLGLCFLLSLLLVLPPVQRYITGQATSFLEEKLQSRVEVGGLYLFLPRSIRLTEVLVEEPNQDTLLYAKEVVVRPNLWALLGKRVALPYIELEGIQARVLRKQPEGTFNFDFILEAFAGEPDTVKQRETATPWEVEIGEIQLRDIRASYHDELIPIEVDTEVGDLNLTFHTFSLQPMRFLAESLEGCDTRIRVSRGISPQGSTEETSPEERSPAIDLQTGVKNLELAGFSVSYRDEALGLETSVDLGETNLQELLVDLASQKILLDSWFLGQSETHLSLFPEGKDTTLTVQSQTPDTGFSAPWVIEAGAVSVQDNHLLVDNGEDTGAVQGFDPNHLVLSSLELDAQNIRLAGAEMGLDLRHLSFLEKSGWRLDQLSLVFRAEEEELEVRDLLVQTPFQTFRGKLSMQGEQVMERWAEAGLQASLEAQGKPLRELILFAPEFQKEAWYQNNVQEEIYAYLEAAGSLERLDFPQVILSGLRGTHLEGQGRAKNLAAAQGLAYAFSLDTLHTVTEDLKSFLPDSLWPAELALPGTWLLSGAAQGNLHEMEASLLLSSSLGEVMASGCWEQDGGDGRDSFSAEVDLPGFKLGTLLADSSMGELALSLLASGTGLTTDSLSVDGKAFLYKAEYRDYVYQDLLAAGSLRGDKVSLEASMDDSGLGFKLSAEAERKAEGGFDARLTGSLNHADLYGLGWYPFPLALQSEIQAEVEVDAQENLLGRLQLRNAWFRNDTTQYLLEQVQVMADLAPSWTEILLDSDILNIRFAGNLGIDEIPGVMQHHLAHYFQVTDTLVARNDYRMDLDMELNNTALFTEILLPDLETLSPASLKAHLDTRLFELAVKLNLPKAVYAGIQMDSLFADLSSDSTTLTYTAGLGSASMDSLRLNKMEMGGSISGNTWRNRFEVTDPFGKQLYLLGNRFSIVDSLLEVYLVPGELVLKGEAWDVEEDNYLRLAPGSFSAHHLILEKDGQGFSLETPEKDLEIGFRQFDLQNLLGFLQPRDSVQLVRGLLEGAVRLSPGKEDTKLALDLEVDSLVLMQYPLGHLEVNASNPGTGTYNLDLSLLNDENQFQIKGSYAEAEQQPMDFHARIHLPDIAFMNSFPLEGVSGLRGGLQGDLDIKGAPSNFRLKGELGFRNTSFWIDALSARYTIPEGNWIFDDKGVRFDRFAVVDTLGNPFNIDGYLYTQNYQDFTLGLNLRAQDFLALSAQKGDNEMYYGTLRMDLDAKLKGDLLGPEVAASLGIGKGTDLTLLTPGEDLELITDEGVVVFVDSSMTADLEKEAGASLADTLLNRMSGLDLTLNLKVAEQAIFTVMVDPNAGDYLTLQGRANLVFSYERSGTTNLSGTYEVASGLYQLSFYGLVKKQFDFQPGSYITWSGDIMDANMSITATHVVRTTSLALVSNEVAGSNAEQQLARQLLPYEVNLNIEGSLKEPEMGFAIDLPARYRSNYPVIDSKLNLLSQPDREAELNRQVFALLVMGGFIPEDPTGGSGTGANFATTAARNSVNAILTQQLNNLSNQYIKGVDLDFGLNSYQDPSSSAAQTRTELNVRVSKKLFDERLTLEVGNRYDVEGKPPSQGNTVGAAEFAVIYELTPSGNYKIRAFRENAFDFLDGELQNTGLAFIFIREFDSRQEFRELKQENREARQKKKAAKQKEREARK